MRRKTFAFLYDKFTRAICATFYHNQSGFVNCISKKTFVFFRFTVYIAVVLYNRVWRCKFLITDWNATTRAVSSLYTRLSSPKLIGNANLSPSGFVIRFGRAPTAAARQYYAANLGNEIRSKIVCLSCSIFLRYEVTTRTVLRLWQLYYPMMTTMVMIGLQELYFLAHPAERNKRFYSTM